VKKSLLCRSDLFKVTNSMRLSVRHYAKGYFAIDQKEAVRWMINRLFFVLDNTDGGENYLRDGDRKIVFESDCLYFIPGSHPVEMHLNGRLHFISVQFNLELVPGTDIFSGCSGVYIWKHPWMLGGLDKIIESRGEMPMELMAMELKYLVYSAAFQLAGNYPVESFANVGRLHKYSLLIRELERSGNAGTRVADLAKTAGECREGFSRRFRDETGMTPKQLLMRVVIEKSLRLLLAGATVKETAAQLEFSDEFVFSRFFKKQMGMPPSAWREMNHFPMMSGGAGVE